MRILMVSEANPKQIGGIETYLTNLMNEFEGQGHQIVRLVFGSSTYGLPDKSCIVLPEKYPWLKRIVGRFSYSYNLLYAAKSCKQLNIDVLIVCTPFAAVSGWVLAKRLSKPSLLFCFELFGNVWNHLNLNPVFKFCGQRLERMLTHLPYNRIACPSVFVKNKLLEIGAKQEQVDVIPLGIHHRFIPDLDSTEYRLKWGFDNAKVVGYCGRLENYGQKNLRQLLQTMALVVKQCPDARLALAGVGFDKLVPYIKQIGLLKYVIYVGALPIEELPFFYCACDVIAGTSQTEGFGLMYAEAMRCGRPVVCTRVGALVEFITDGQEGFLCTPGNINEIADAILKVLLDTNLAKSLGRRGIKRTEQLTWRRCADAHIISLEKVLSTSQSQYLTHSTSRK